MLRYFCLHCGAPEGVSDNCEVCGQDIVILLCPYCLGRVAEETGDCPHCLADTSDDAKIETRPSATLREQFKTCRHCEGSIHHLAIRCPGCRQWQSLG